jgi:hypothetical protein
MAVNKAPAASFDNRSGAEGEVTEREYQATLNRAVEDTESEIFADALGEDELDNDADTSLEDMGEGLEGEVEDDAKEDAQGEGEGEEAEGGEGEEADPSTRAQDAEGEAQEQPRDQRGQFQEREPTVPSYRVREQTQRATAAEERAQLLERQVAEMNGRLAELSARANAPPPRQQQAEAPKPEPDVFSEPDAWKQWNREQQAQIARQEAQQLFFQFERQQQERESRRIDQAFITAANGPRGFEVAPAYQAFLAAHDPRNPYHVAAVQRVTSAPDPAQAMLDWWDQNGGPEYREQVYQQVAPRMQQRNNGARQPQGQQSFDQRSGPRQVFRPAQRLPSLNSATGSNSQRVSDPEMLDGSDDAIFRFGTRR